MSDSFSTQSEIKKEEDAGDWQCPQVHVEGCPQGWYLADILVRDVLNLKIERR
jgi:hypothetical protein